VAGSHRLASNPLAGRIDTVEADSV